MDRNGVLAVAAGGAIALLGVGAGALVRGDDAGPTAPVTVTLMLTETVPGPTVTQPVTIVSDVVTTVQEPVAPDTVTVPG